MFCFNTKLKRPGVVRFHGQHFRVVFFSTNWRRHRRGRCHGQCLWLARFLPEFPLLLVEHGRRNTATAQRVEAPALVRMGQRVSLVRLPTLKLPLGSNPCCFSLGLVSSDSCLGVAADVFGTLVPPLFENPQQPLRLRSFGCSNSTWAEVLLQRVDVAANLREVSFCLDYGVHVLAVRLEVLLELLPCSLVALLSTAAL